MTNASTKSRRRDKEATRAEILNAAEDLFARKGFADTALSEIAGQAGVTKSLIHHHFGTKKGLWTEVKGRNFDSYRALHRQFLQGDEPITQQLAGAFRAFFEFLKTHPRLVRMLGWTNLEQLGETRAPGMELVELGVKELERAQRQGQIRADINPVFIILSLVSLTEHWFTCRDAFCPVHDLLDRSQADEAFVEDMIKIIIDGIRPR